MLACGVCGREIEVGVGVKGDECPHCRAPARWRALPSVLSDLVLPRMAPGLRETKPLLGFAVANMEEKCLRPTFPQITSVSLYGSFLPGHIEGVDICDLRRFPDASFCGVYGVSVFDFVVDQAAALRECARVTAPGGVFVTSVLHGHLVDRELPPVILRQVHKRPGYFEYLPDDVKLHAVQVGRGTFVRMMGRAGWSNPRYHLRQGLLAGVDTDWFLGSRAL